MKKQLFIFLLDLVHLPLAAQNPLFNRTFCTDTVSTITPAVQVLPDGGGCGDEEKVRKQIYAYLETEQNDSLLALLHCVNTEWAIKILVGTYVDSYDYDKALNELQKIGDNSAENIEFKALYNAIINGGLNGDAGSGKADAADYVQQIATNQQTNNRALAESVLAIYQGEEYVRSGESIAFKAENTKPAAPTFTLMPNPAQSVVTIEWLMPINSKQTGAIFDLSGKKVLSFVLEQTTTTIDVRALQTGIYYCRLDDGQTAAKLVIIK